MATAIIAGGSIAGLAAALALADAGHRVRVLERAPRPPMKQPAAVGEQWQDPLVPQRMHSHTLTSLGVQVLRRRAPGVLAAATAAGARPLDLTAAAPPDYVPEPGDADLVALGCRRSVLELALYRHVKARSRVSIEHGARVRELLLRPGGDVAGVITDSGERITAAVVVDATGRRAEHRNWLVAAGRAVTADQEHPSGLAGFTRAYRLLRPGSWPGPLNRGNAAGGIYDHYAGVLHPADGDTFTVALAVLPRDGELRALRRAEPFDVAARATPYLARWLDAAEPLAGPYAITSPPNVLRRTAVSPEHVVPGLYPVGDAACVTNPLFGRGMSLAFAHAFALGDLLAAGPPRRSQAPLAAARLAERLYRPWFEQAAAADCDRIGRWQAAARGAAVPAPGPQAVAAAAARTDARVWRGLTRVLMGLATPSEVFGDDAFQARAHGARQPAGVEPAPPTRDDLVKAVTASEGGPR